jgi:hypothetical protein
MVVELEHLLIGPVNSLALVRDLGAVYIQQVVNLLNVYVLQVF